MVRQAGHLLGKKGVVGSIPTLGSRTGRK